MAISERHRTRRLAIALWIRHPEIPLRTLLQIAALLVTDQHDGPPGKLAHAGDEREVVSPPAIAVKLEEIVEDPLDVVEGVRAILMSRKLDRAPDLVGVRL